MESNSIIVLTLILVFILFAGMLFFLILYVSKKSRIESDKLFTNYIKAKQIIKEKGLHSKLTIQKAHQKIDEFIENKKTDTKSIG